MMHPSLAAGSALGLALALSACAVPIATGEAPQTSAPVPAALTGEAQIEDLLARMTLERKIAQLIMPDIASITPEDVRKYRFGTILNGGNSGPGGDDAAPAPEWLALADAYWDASTAPLPGGEPAIPALWATDAVHGHSNIPGATIFPHNIGLGATRDPQLMRDIGRVTAAEIAVTGIDWTFAPTLAVATDDRWGRTYESFSEDPALVAQLGEATIRGFQGEPGTQGFLDQTRVIATAKHFYGDGGTAGKDRGDTRGDPATLKAVHGAPYPPAIDAGVQTVMASFSSVNGEKVHGSTAILTDYLRGELGFEGLVVGDWNGHGELAACSNVDCPKSLMAGLDIFMVPEDWKGLYENLLTQARDGTVPMTRVDEAVRRILRVKQAYGVFDRPKPSARQLAGNFAMLGSQDHREVARRAVRQSLVLLENDGVLPLESSANVLVAGKAADDIAQQSGGWSITWQGGGDLANEDFPGATSIFVGIDRALTAGGGSATLSPDGSYSARPDAAVVVFGEEPYSEFVGDRDDLALRDEEGLELLRKFDEADIPTVAVFLSGRPLWMNRELALADAFVAAWLPGSEGGGIADVLVSDADGAIAHDFTGKLAFGWPGGCAPDAAVIFRFGAGWSYANPPAQRDYDTDCALLELGFGAGLRIFERGMGPGLKALARDAKGQTSLSNLSGKSPSGILQVSAFDSRAQEDARRAQWGGPAQLLFGWQERAFPQDAALRIRYRLNNVPDGGISLRGLCDDCDIAVDLASTFTLGAGKGWRNATIPLTCLTSDDAAIEPAGIALQSDAAFIIELESVGIIPEANFEGCDGPF